MLVVNKKLIKKYKQILILLWLLEIHVEANFRPYVIYIALQMNWALDSR